MIDIVTLSTNHMFRGNPMHAQHVLRYESTVVRQKWDVPVVNDMEYDTYDNPAAYYLVKRDMNGRALGCSRLYPTDRPYMLEQIFSHLVTKVKMPKDTSVWEGSRFCIDQNLPPEDRRQISRELIIGYLEFALDQNIKSIVGVMYPIYWRNLFIKNGWDVLWIGDMHKSVEGHKIIAGDLRVSQEVLDNVRQVTGIHAPILNYTDEQKIVKVA